MTVGADDVVYCKSTSMQIWLIGYELADTMMLFCQNNIVFLSSKKKIDFLRPLESAARPDDAKELPQIKLLVRDKVIIIEAKFKIIFTTVQIE